jgi:hypothetical protein
LSDHSSRAALAAVVGLALGLGLGLGSSRADAGIVFNFAFDNGGLGESPPAMPPFVGSGTFTIANDPGNGTFLLNSLSGFSASFLVGSDQFTTADIQTPLNQIEVVLTSTAMGQRLQFSNTNSFGTGPEAGSIDFINSSGAALTFEPPGYGGLNSYQEFGPMNSSQLAGDYQGLAVPEPPSAILALIGGLVATGAGLLRRRAASASSLQESSP